MTKFVAEVANRSIIIVALLLCCADQSAAQEFKFLEVTVFDENSKPMADVPVEIKMDGLKFPMPTDELGMISLNVSAGRNPVELLIRHEGYETQKIRWRRGSEVPTEHSFKLQPGKPGQGWVVDATGKPVAGAEIFAALPDKSLTFVNGKNPPESKQTAILTDEQGKFTLPFQSEGSTIVCLGDSGWAQFVKAKDQDDQLKEIKLTPWAQVQLLAKPRDKDRSGEKVGLHFLKAIEKDRGNVEWLYQGMTDGQAKIDLDRVIPGTAIAYREVEIQTVKGQPTVDKRSHGVITHLQPGDHAQAVIGFAKHKASGKLMLPADYKGQVNWESGYVALTENNVLNLTLRTAIFEYGKLLSQANVYNPRDRVPPSAQPSYLVRYLAAIQSDGSFEIDGLPAGQYKFSATVTAQPILDRDHTDILSLEEIPFTITNGDDEPSSAIDLGEHILDHTDSFAKEAE